MMTIEILFYPFFQSLSPLLFICLVLNQRDYHFFLKCLCWYPLHLLFSLLSLYLIFSSRTTAAALLQSLPIIHTSDPPDTHCLLSYNAPQFQNFPRHIWASVCSPFKVPLLSLILPVAFQSVSIQSVYFSISISIQV